MVSQHVFISDLHSVSTSHELYIFN